jgi:NAD(P)-dependent dehydrogenase (short-subunit alcohol dehydrogenase family)
MNFNGKVVIVTGSGSGMGRAAAIMFAKNGAKVAVTALKPNGIDNGEETVRLIKKNGGEAIFIPGDITNCSTTEKIVAETVKKYGRIDILVNNAGVVLNGTIDTITEKQFDLSMGVNVKGTFFMSQCAIREMRKQGGGVILIIASTAGIFGAKGKAAYSTSKGALVALTRSMCADVSGANIRVNCICPGTVATAALEQRIQAAADPVAEKALFLKHQPEGRLGREDELATAMLFACSDEVEYLNGSIIAVDGGMTSHLL